jgi:hypothetical protein
MLNIAGLNLTGTGGLHGGENFGLTAGSPADTLNCSRTKLPSFIVNPVLLAVNPMLTCACASGLNQPFTSAIDTSIRFIFSSK